MGCVGSGGEVDHGELSGGAHREAQEQRAAPQLCLGRVPLPNYRHVVNIPLAEFVCAKRFGASAHECSQSSC